jgi:hypothetical protein
VTGASPGRPGFAAVDLTSLHAVLPLMACDAELSTRYGRFLGRVRALVHPPGVEDVRTVQTDAGPLDVDLGDDDGCRLFYGAAIAAAQEALFVGLLRPADCIVDVGAGFGLTTVGCGRLVAGGEGKGSIHAFEHRAGQRDLLERNLQRNGLTAQVTVHAEAIAGLDPGADRSAGIALDEYLRAHGVSHLDVLRTAAHADALTVLTGATLSLRTAADPIVRVDLGAEQRLGADGLHRLEAAVRALEGCDFAAYTVDCAGVLAAGWPGGESSGAVLAGDTVTVLLVRAGGERENRLRARLPVVSSVGIRVPALHEQPAHTQATPASLPTTVSLITAMAVARLRELDAITGLMSAQLAPPTRGGTEIDGRNVAAAWQEAMQRDDDIFTLQGEIERLLNESETRLREARQFRQEAKALRARYEVIGGQRLREAAIMAREFLARLRARRGAPKRRR